MKKVSSNISQVARILFKNNNILLFSTVSLSGGPRSRFMGACVILDNAEFYLISPSNSRKIKEIVNNSLSQVIFFTKDYQQILTLTGVASVVQDFELRKSIYEKNKDLKIYPVFDDFFGVIHFHFVEAEYLNLKLSDSPVIFELQCG